jgi:hypothetical protein
LVELDWPVLPSTGHADESESSRVLADRRALSNADELKEAVALLVMSTCTESSTTSTALVYAPLDGLLSPVMRPDAKSGAGFLTPLDVTAWKVV